MSLSISSSTEFPYVIGFHLERVPIHLGVSDAERKQRQHIGVEIKFFLKNAPTGCHSDDINDTICYHDISNHIRACCSARAFHLIEHLAEELFGLLRKETVKDETIKIWLRIEKYGPFAGGGPDGASFEYSDF